MPPHFTAAQRETLSAMAAVVLEGAPPASERPAELIARCEARMTTLPPDRVALVGTALDVLGSAAAVALALGTPRRFTRLSPADQARCFTAWTDSSLPPIRSAWQSVRRLLFAVHYARPEVTAAVGYRGPFAARGAHYPWEGSLPFRASPAREREPIARGPVVLPGALDPDPRPANVITADQVTGPVHRTADVVIVGSGAGGSVTAALLAEAGYEVVLLESGAWHDRADYTEDEAALTARLFADGGLRTTDDAGVSLLQGATVGGGTTVNWMLMLRTPPWVLEQWADEHGVYGMSPADMAPVFDEVEHLVHAARMPDDAHSANNRLLLDGARTLGWRVTSGMINARGCVRCGFCSYGCRHNAKQSAQHTWLPRALQAGATLYTQARATCVDVRERDRGVAHAGTPPRKRVHATVHTVRGEQALTIDAPIVVIAAGAVETPVLLQRSGFGGGGVGEWLRLHPTVGTAGLYDHDVAPSTGTPMTTMCDEFLRWRGTDYGYWIETPPMHPSFTAAGMPGFGPAHAARMAQMNRLGVLISLTRDGAERHTSSGRVRVDRRGRTSIAYRLTTEDEQRVRDSLVSLARLHFANGAREVFSLHASPIVVRNVAAAGALATGSIAPNRMAIFSAHVNGTCRMGTDAAVSGASPDGERHGVRGLYIMDGSLLPTALGVNPQETIMAVTTVLARRLAARHGGVRH